jgi:periplasmic divalent cation tolerance protein
MSDFKIIYVTCSDKHEAQNLSKLCLEKNLIACANIFPEIESIYKWQDKIETQKETVMILKTSFEQVEELMAFVLKHHSYDCPCILCFDIESLDDSFSRFLTSSLS